MGVDPAAVYAVSWDELRSLPKSGRLDLAKVIGQDFFHSDEVDEWFAEEDPPNTLENAVRQILSGEPLLSEGTIYGYAVEGLCWAIGTTFLQPDRFATVDALDEFLTARSSPVKMSKLLYSGFPIPIPEPGDFPIAGYWTPAQCRKAIRFFKELRLSRANPTIKASIEMIRSWLDAISEHDVDALVAFSY